MTKREELRTILLNGISGGHIELGPLTKYVNAEMRKLGYKNQYSMPTVSARIRDHIPGMYDKMHKTDKNGTKHCYYIIKNPRRLAA